MPIKPYVLQKSSLLIPAREEVEYVHPGEIGAEYL
jgi:hypothetical protein